MGLLLYLVYLVLSAVCIPIGVVFTIIKCIWEGKSVGHTLRMINNHCKLMSISGDVHANVSCKDLFNALFIKRGGYYFGNRKETISSALGKNLERNTLTWLGRGLNQILNLFEKNHSQKSIDQLV